MKCVVVDTNVPKVANGRDEAPQVLPTCVAVCAQRLHRLQQEEVLVLDSQWRILREYMDNLRSSGQPGPGDAFLKWVLTNHANPERCEKVDITPRPGPDGDFVGFPSDPGLTGFDPADHKFVAVALAHSQQPPILNAADSDWWLYRDALAACGVKVHFLCPDAMPCRGIGSD